MAIIPGGGASPAHRSSSRFVLPSVRTGDISGGRAIVMEPFATLLGHDDQYGSFEAGVLTRAGFHVDILRNKQVTVNSMRNLADYSVVYMETHSGVLPNGDALIAVNETDLSQYASMLSSGDGSVSQVLVAGDPTHTLYNAIQANFIKLHVGTFPDSSLVFINGCELTDATRFWAALKSRNVAALLGWDNEVQASDNEATSNYVLQHLLTGQNVADSVAAARAAGLGVSVVNGTTSHLAFVGDPDDTLSRALAQATPTPLPTATPTQTPISTPTTAPIAATKGHVHTHLRCKRGWRVVHGKCRRCPTGHCKKH